MYEDILIFIYSIFYKLADEFDDEEIYNLYFPNGKLIIYPILILYTIYLFYFNDYKSDTFIIFFFIELFYILILFLCYFDIFLCKIAEVKLTLQDPFALLTIVKFPMFIYKFYYSLSNKLLDIIYLFIIIILVGIFQDVDNSILGTYILNNKYKNKNKKEYKIIYRTFLVLLFFLCYFIFKRNINQLTMIFAIGYFGTSVVSLTLQIILENNLEDKNLKLQLDEFKKSLNT
jgi:hypothetical protein